MENITKNEIRTLLTIVKSPEVMYNANSLSKDLGITSMGTLKILKRLEDESILKSRKIGKSTIYRINIKNNYSKEYIGFLLSRESSISTGLIKRWVNEIKKIKNASIAILFGSVLEKKSPKDIDVLLITDQARFIKLKSEVEELNKINIKKIHPVYQSFKDVVKNIKKRDKVILNAIKGIVVFGGEKFLRVYNESS